MRTSILSRSALAVATLAVASAALVATPATAATATGVTRDQVLTAANGMRAAIASDDNYDFATYRAINGIVNRSCAVDIDAGDYVYFSASPAAAGNSADGVIITASIYHSDDTSGGYRTCVITALATTDPSRQLTGSATVSIGSYVEQNNPSDTFSAAGATTPYTSALSGDVFVTPAINLTGNTYLQSASFTTAGAAVKTIKTTKTTKVKDKKTTSEKKAAKSKYSKRLDAAKKKYDKALDKAGSSKSKQAAAKKAYSASKASAKAKYKYAVASYKIVKKTTSRVDSAPFSFGVTADNYWFPMRKGIS